MAAVADLTSVILVDIVAMGRIGFTICFAHGRRDARLNLPCGSRADTRLER